LRRQVRPPQPKGAGGQQPPRAVGREYPACVGTPIKTTLVLRQTTIAAEAATAKNRGIRRWERQRELFDPPRGNRRRTKMPRRAASAA